MRRTVTATALWLALWALVGVPQAQSLHETAIVEAIGVDADGAGYRLTAQIYLPQGSGSEPSNMLGSENTVLLLGEGSTLAEAVAHASRQQGKQLALGFSQVMVVGESAKERLPEIEAFFVTEPRVNWTMAVAFADGSAQEIVGAQFPLGIAEGHQIQKLLRQQSGITLYDSYAAYQNDENVKVPTIRLLPGEEGENGKIAISPGILVE